MPDEPIATPVDDPTATPSGGTSGPTPRPARQARTSRPNYAARRMLVTTIAITAIVAAGVFGWRTLRSDDGTSSGSGRDWDEIALIDRSSGAVTTVDRDGETVSNTVGLGRVNDVHEHRDRLVLVGADQLVVQSPDEEPVVVSTGLGATVTPLRTPDTMHLAIGRATGGNILLVDTDDGSVVDIAALATPGLPSTPFMFAETLRWNMTGSLFAVADATNFQTIVIGDELEGPAFLTDIPVAIGDELVATSEARGRQADVALVDLEGRNQANAASEIPAGGIMVGDEMVMVSIDGAVSRIGKGDTEAERIGTVSVPSGSTVNAVHPVAGGERLLVEGGAFAAVIDLEGGTVFTTTFATPIEIDVPDPSWSCLPIGGGDTYHSIVDLDTGELLADLTGIDVIDVAGDGCTVVGERNGIAELITADGAVRLGQLRHVFLAPDGRSIVWTTTTGRTELVRVDGDLELGDPTVLEMAPGNLTVAFLDR